MTEQELAAMNAGKSKRNAQQPRQSLETAISSDLTADYQAGRDFVDARVKAFGAGVSDRMNEVKQAMANFTGGKFVIAEASYQRPALPASEEQTTNSVLSLLFGEDTDNA